MKTFLVYPTGLKSKKLIMLTVMRNLNVASYIVFDVIIHLNVIQIMRLVVPQ